MEASNNTLRLRVKKYVFTAFLLAIIGSVAAYFIFGGRFELEQARQFLNGFELWAPLVFIALYTIGTIFIPSTPFMAAAGILFGFKYGLVYAAIGGLLSSTVAFAISRKLGRVHVENFLNNRYKKRLAKYNERLERGAVWDLILFRITPIMPFNALNVLMGVSKIKTRDYVIGTLIGLIPSNIVTVYFGNFLAAMF